MGLMLACAQVSGDDLVGLHPQHGLKTTAKCRGLHGTQSEANTARAGHETQTNVAGCAAMVLEVQPPFMSDISVFYMRSFDGQLLPCLGFLPLAYVRGCFRVSVSCERRIRREGPVCGVCASTLAIAFVTLGLALLPSHVRSTCAGSVL